MLEFKDRSLKSHLGRASKLGASCAVIIGNEEIESKRVVFKDLTKGKQIETEMNWMEHTTASEILRLLQLEFPIPWIFSGESSKQNHD